MRSGSGSVPWLLIGGVDEDDIYQILAYAIRYKCNHMELVYPAPDGTVSRWQEPPVFRIDVGDDSERTLWITVGRLRSGEYRGS